MPEQLVGFTGAVQASIPGNIHLQLMHWLSYIQADLPPFMEWLTLTEHSIEEHLPRLLGGYACPIIAKLLFLLLSRLRGGPHIDFLTFSHALLPLMSEYSEIRGEVIFRLLDVDGDGKLSILNIL